MGAIVGDAADESVRRDLLSWNGPETWRETAPERIGERMHSGAVFLAPRSAIWRVVPTTHFYGQNEGVDLFQVGAEDYVLFMDTPRGFGRGPVVRALRRDIERHEASRSD